MNIQIITGNVNLKNESGITISNYSKSSALDDFDINIVDLSYDGLWFCEENEMGKLNCGNDLAAIKHMVDYSTKSLIIYVYPQNGVYSFDSYEGLYYEKVQIRDVFADQIASSILAEYFLYYIDKTYLICESTKTTIGDEIYEADFHFTTTDQNKVITKSNISDKTTTVRYDKNIYITTLNVCASNESIKNFINSLFGEKINEEIPEWVREYDFGDDKEQRELINKNTERIENLKKIIENANKRLNNNNRYKSVLYTSGDQLVEVVFEILEIILDCSLKEFVDEKKEDFLINKGESIFIGEIKGVNTNVKNPHITQLELNYQTYIEDINDDKLINNIHPILIINPLRKTELNNREQVHEKQVKLACDRGILIIETKTLLKLFEFFQAKKLTTEQIIKVLTTKTGLLEMSDFN